MIFLVILGIILLAVVLQLVPKFVYGLFFYILNLGFLPAGYDIARNIKPTGIYVLPFIGAIIEVPLHYFLTLWINIVDFICWIPSKVPLIKNVLRFIDRCPDLDMNTHGIDPVIEIFGLTGHRNFITHSIMNPYMVLILGIGVILYLLLKLISKKAKNIIALCIALCFAVFSAHLFADCMPNGWQGGALIKVEIFGTLYVTFGKILSKLWLFVHGLIALNIGGFFMGRLNADIDIEDEIQESIDKEEKKTDFVMNTEKNNEK